MQFLFELAESGSVREANRYRITSFARGLLSGKVDSHSNHVQDLGIAIARRILEQEPDTGKAAAILLLTALDSAYNSVLAVSLDDQ